MAFNYNYDTSALITGPQQFVANRLLTDRQNESRRNEAEARQSQNQANAIGGVIGGIGGAFASGNVVGLAHFAGADGFVLPQQYGGPSESAQLQAAAQARPTVQETIGELTFGQAPPEQRQFIANQMGIDPQQTQNLNPVQQRNLNQAIGDMTLAQQDAQRDQAVRFGEAEQIMSYPQTVQRNMQLLQSGKADWSSAPQAARQEWEAIQSARARAHTSGDYGDPGTPQFAQVESAFADRERRIAGSLGSRLRPVQEPPQSIEHVGGFNIPVIGPGGPVPSSTYMVPNGRGGYQAIQVKPQEQPTTPPPATVQAAIEQGVVRQLANGAWIGIDPSNGKAFKLLDAPDADEIFGGGQTPFDLSNAMKVDKQAMDRYKFEYGESDKAAEMNESPVSMDVKRSRLERIRSEMSQQLGVPMSRQEAGMFSPNIDESSPFYRPSWAPSPSMPEPPARGGGGAITLDPMAVKRNPEMAPPGGVYEFGDGRKYRSVGNGKFIPIGG